MSGALAMIRPVLEQLSRWRDRLPASLRRPGVLGIVLTPGGETVLVRHTYRPGWFPPGGGRKRGEGAEAAVLRELGEEIGLVGWSTIEPVEHDEAGLAIFVVRDAVYRPRWSLEIDAVNAFPPDRLPQGTSLRLRQLLPLLITQDRLHAGA